MFAQYSFIITGLLGDKLTADSSFLVTLYNTSSEGNWVILSEAFDCSILASNKIFLISIARFSKEEENKNKSINSIIKFEFINSSKSKNIDQNDTNLTLELLTIDIFKKGENFEIIMLFSKNRIITLAAEVIEVTLEDQKIVNDKNN